ncbi:MAG TPA: hypothetical protein VFP68_00590 [Burkholderiaceae bacterium]|nr:hypothetical protein [Burkholderiaceae bacterium]
MAERSTARDGRELQSPDGNPEALHLERTSPAPDLSPLEDNVDDDELLDVAVDEPFFDDTQLLIAFMDKAVMATSPKQVNELREHADGVRKEAEQLTPSLADPAFTHAFAGTQENVASGFSGLINAAHRFRSSAWTWRIAASHYRELVAAARRAGLGKDEVNEIDVWRAKCAAQAQRQIIQHDLTQIVRLIKRMQTTRKKPSLEAIEVVHRMLHQHLFRALQGCRSAGLHAIPLAEHPISAFDRELLYIEPSIRRLIEMASDRSQEPRNEDNQRSLRRGSHTGPKELSRQGLKSDPAAPSSSKTQTAPKWLEKLWAENEQMVELAIALKSALSGYDLPQSEASKRTATHHESNKGLGKQVTAARNPRLTPDASAPTPATPQAHCRHDSTSALSCLAETTAAAEAPLEPHLKIEPELQRRREALSAELAEDFKGLLFKLESTAANGEAPWPELVRQCDEALSKLHDSSLLQGQDDGRFDPRSMAAPFVAIQAAASALKEPANTAVMALARAGRLESAAADALRTAAANQHEWADHLREFAARSKELRRIELAHAADLERAQLDDYLKSKEKEVKGLLEYAVDKVAAMAMLLNGDPVCDAKTSAQNGPYGARDHADADDHLANLGGKLAQDLEDRIQGTIRMPFDTPKGEAARLRLAKLLTESLSITCRHATGIVETAVSASRLLMDAPPRDRSKIAAELAERVREATTISAARHASLDDSRDSLPAETCQRYKPAWKRNERIGQEMGHILLVLSTLFEARHEAMELVEQVHDSAARLGHCISRITKKFEQSLSACVAQMQRLHQLIASPGESTDYAADMGRISASFSDLAQRIDHERIIALARLCIRKADPIVNDPRESIRTRKRLENFKDAITDPIDDVKRMNATLRHLKRDDAGRSPLRLSQKIRSKRSAMIATRLVIGLDLMKQLQGVQRKIARREANANAR